MFNWTIYIDRRNVYGNNEIVIPVKSIFTLLCLEVLNPFYVFQLFSFCLWVADDYYYYAMVILAMSSAGIMMAVFQTRRVSHFSLFLAATSRHEQTDRILFFLESA